MLIKAAVMFDCYIVGRIAKEGLGECWGDSSPCDRAAG